MNPIFLNIYKPRTEEKLKNNKIVPPSTFYIRVNSSSSTSLVLVKVMYLITYIPDVRRYPIGLNLQLSMSGIYLASITTARQLKRMFPAIAAPRGMKKGQSKHNSLIHRSSYNRIFIKSRAIPQNGRARSTSLEERKTRDRVQRVRASCSPGTIPDSVNATRTISRRS